MLIKNLICSGEKWRFVRSGGMLERVSCTYPIAVKGESYVWAFYVSVLTSQVKGLALYNITTGEQVKDPKVITDFLKILYAYEIAMDKTFQHQLMECLRYMEQSAKTTERDVEKFRTQLRAYDRLFPDFVQEAWISTFDLMMDVWVKREEQRDILLKHKTWMEQFTGDFPLTGKWLAEFLSDLYGYYQVYHEILQLKEGAQENTTIALGYFDVLGGSAAIQRMREFVESYLEDYKPTEAILQQPLIRNLIEQDFADNIITPYHQYLR
jgi:hypothetical protein